MSISFQKSCVDSGLSSAEFWMILNLLAYSPTTNGALANMLGWGLNKAIDVKKTLIKRGILIEKKKLNPYEIREIILKKTFDGLGIGLLKCEWCNVKSYALHQHHFPISKSNGGDKVVNICANCHTEYHSIEYINYDISKDFIDRYLITVEP